MKKIYNIVAMTVCALMLGSCSDFLDQSSPSDQSTETTYESTYYTGLVVNKIYGQLNLDETYSQAIPIIWGAGTDTELIDATANPQSDGKERAAMTYLNSATSWDKIDKWWSSNYSVIEYCNLAIDGIRKSKLYQSGAPAEKKQMQRYLGETLTIRAMVYQDIIRMWGNVPMSVEPVKPDLSNAYLQKTDRDVILDYLMNDMEEAIELLPWADAEGGYTTEHATKGYAKALYAQLALTRAGYAIREAEESTQKLAEGYEKADYSDDVYMTLRPGKEKRDELYQKAAAQLADIISDQKHSLNPSFENEWFLLNQQQLDKTYHENLFEIPLLANVTGELGYTIGKRMNGITTDFGYNNSSGKLKTTAMLFFSYDEDDTRRDVTVAVSEFKQDGDNTKEQFLKGVPVSLYLGKWRPEWMNESWLSQNKAASAKHCTGINCVRMRYSQVLLYYAECLNELVGPDATLSGISSNLTAREALSIVHNRALNKGAENKDASWMDAYADKSFFEMLVQENAWELTGEGIRKFDLIRWGILAQQIANAKKQFVDDCQTWPLELTFEYADAAKTRINMKKVDFYGDSQESYTETTGDGNSPFAVKVSETSTLEQNKNYMLLENACSGLVGTTMDGTIDEPVVIAGSPVKNRYVLPIYVTTISDSNGTLSNSYGY